MSQTVTPPKAQVAIGTVLIAGVSYSVITSTEFVRFFENIFTRIGGVSGSSSNDLTLSQFEDAGIEESKAAIYSMRDEFAQQFPVTAAPPVVYEDTGSDFASLREEIHALRARVHALESGLSA